MRDEETYLQIRDMRQMFTTENTPLLKAFKSKNDVAEQGEERNPTRN